jgi:multicomponent Na+:H+ antiporter subunit G
MVHVILTYLGYFFVLVGTAFLFLGGLGIVRMPDIYTRLQASTKASTLGAMSMIFGVGLLHPQWLVKTIVIVVFIALSNPVSSHALARGSYRHKIKPWTKENIDAYGEYIEHEGLSQESQDLKPENQE